MISLQKNVLTAHENVTLMYFASNYLYNQKSPKGLKLNKLTAPFDFIVCKQSYSFLDTHRVEKNTRLKFNSSKRSFPTRFEVKFIINGNHILTVSIRLSCKRCVWRYRSYCILTRRRSKKSDLPVGDRLSPPMSLPSLPTATPSVIPNIVFPGKKLIASRKTVPVSSVRRWDNM